MKPKPDQVPTELDAIADIVLAYKPKAKTDKAKKRKKLAAKLAKPERGSSKNSESFSNQK
jgi:hypothetical protein